MNISKFHIKDNLRHILIISEYLSLRLFSKEFFSKNTLLILLLGNTVSYFSQLSDYNIN